MQTPVLRTREAVTTRWTAKLGAVKLVFGPDTRLELGEVVRSLGGRRPLLVTDPAVRAKADIDVLVGAMGDELDVMVWDDTPENPTTTTIEAGAEAARAHEPDIIVGFGGGSAMDAAKGINFLLTNGGTMDDYEGYDRAGTSLLPSIGVPTTAGTGSEAQSYALISRAEDHRKMACGSPTARFRVAILDPELLTTVPRAVRFATGIDAVSHAVESHVCTRSNPISRLFSKRAFQLLSRSFIPSLATEADLPTRGDMLLGAHFAGAAIEASMLGAAHACANPLTARYGMVHGIAVGLMLPHVVHHNFPVVGAKYFDIADGDIVDILTPMIAAGEVPLRLRDHGVAEEALPELAASAATQWTAQFNPRPVEEADLHAIYESAY